MIEQRQDDPNPELLHVAGPEEFLPPINWWITLGGLVLLATLGASVVLAGVLKYRVTVRAPATVRPAGELRIVQSATEGTVLSIAVEANQAVQEGDVIAYIDGSRLRTKQSQLQGNIQQATQDQIGSQILAIDSQIAAETDLLNRTIAAAEAELDLNQRQYRDKLITTTSEVQEAEAALEFAREELAGYRELNRGGLVPELELKRKEALMKAAEARLNQVKAGLDPSTAQVEMAKQKITQERARGEATIARLRKEREQLIERQGEIQNQVSSDRDELRQIEVEISHTVIRAPTSGIIQELTLRNKGQVVSSGEIIARIAPSDSPLEVKAFVASQDIGQVEIGQTVHVRVSACPYPDYGTLKGTVSAISPDVMLTDASQGRRGQGAVYEVTIRPESLTLRAVGGECTIQSGMEGRAEIVSREEAVLQFFLRKARLLADL